MSKQESPLPVRLHRILPVLVALLAQCIGTASAEPFAPLTNDPVRMDSIEMVQDSVLSAAYSALAVDSTLLDPYIRIAGIHKARRDWTNELRAAEQLIRINPYNAEANFTYADALLDNNLPDSAIIRLRRALFMEPEFVRARVMLADAFTIKKAYDSALFHLDTALVLNPRYAQAHWQRGSILVGLGRDTEAVASYQTAAELTPESYSIWMTLSKLLLKVHEPERAADALAYVRQLDPDSADAAYLFADTSMKLGRTEVAQKAFEEFMLRFPRDRRAMDAERMARRLQEGSP